MFGRITFLIVLIILPLVSAAQKVLSISGEYTYYPPEHVSLEVAKRTAIERARLQALADTYGTTIQSTTTTTMKNSSEQSEVDVSMLAANEVRGEWLQDMQPPEITISYENNMLVIRAQVRGKTRKIETAAIDLVVKILCNHTDPKFENDRFQAGDDLFLYFKTPVSGYLAVYLIDDLETAYCLLPYGRDASGVVRVRNDRDYIFFSRQCADKEISPIVDEYVMTSDKSISYNYIYTIFSPNAFAKARDEQGSFDPTMRQLPRETSFDEFQKWLAGCRIRDTKMVVKEQMISIKK